jgi:hypothetical protein
MGQGLEGFQMKEFFPFGVEVYHHASMRMHSPTWKLSKPYSPKIFTKDSSCRHEQLQTQSLALSPSWQMTGKWSWKLKAPKHASNLSGDQPPSKSCLKRCFCNPGNYKRFRYSVSDVPTTKDMTRILRALCQKLWQRHIYILLCITYPALWSLAMDSL